MTRGLMQLAQDPELVRAAAALRLKQQNLNDEALVHPDADGVLWGADFGYKTGPFISPAMFRDLFLEPNRQRVRNLHDRFGVKVLKHCCGNVRPLLDMFVEIGYDAYQSIQPTAGMDICRLKKEYGDRIALWGGVGVENLVGGTPEDVRNDVRRAMACAKPGGRFILGSSHSIAVGTKYENYMAMLDEHRKLRDY
jgi:uroporphyrinogen-III decarboxylase